MDSQTKQCQNCKKDFIIEPEDFNFYEKMNVPAPTFCPECRFQRRIMFRNERTLYKRKCDLCGKDIVTIFSPDSKLIVYCSKCWWSDDWDDSEHFLEYDSSRPFFEQMIELQKKTPHMALINDYATNINSDYVNHAGSLKNCYLIFNADFDENVLYSSIVVHVKDSMDCYMVGESELLYQTIDTKGYKLFFCESCTNCSESYFLNNCLGCDYCFGCINLRNKKYHIFNKPYTKEEYFEKIKEYKLDSYKGLSEIRKIVDAFWMEYPHKYMHNNAQCVNVSGDYVFNAKNALNCYQARQLEDAKYCQFITMSPAKDIYDLTEWGNGAQRVVDSLTVGEGADMAKFCCGAWHQGTMEVEYGMYNLSCQYTFGCINQKKKRYRILNKQYSKEEYFDMVGKIKKHMIDMPYVDKKGRVYKYGEFFPIEFSPFAYNETIANYFYPLSKEDTISNGYLYRDKDNQNHNPTIKTEQIPDSIIDTSLDILQEIISCDTFPGSDRCSGAFRLTRDELTFYKRFNIPIPRMCYQCRHKERFSKRTPLKLWNRKCMHEGCDNEFQTSYAPDRPEVIYCEKCYQQEVI